ncbi:hypothetical protein GCM10017710_09930 [Arthrobacter ramosus]
MVEVLNGDTDVVESHDSRHGKSLQAFVYTAQDGAYRGLYGGFTAGERLLPRGRLRVGYGFHSGRRPGWGVGKPAGRRTAGAEA